MGTSYSFKKRSSLTLMELVISIVILASVLPTLGLNGFRMLQRWQYLQDIQSLKAQLQMAHDMTLHTGIPVQIRFNQTSGGLHCQLLFENKRLDSSLPTSRYYKHIDKMHQNQQLQKSICVYCSQSGSLKNPLQIIFTSRSKKNSKSISLKGYPHVVSVE